MLRAALGWMLVRWWLSYVCLLVCGLENQTLQCAEDGLVKIPLQRMVAQKLDRQPRASDERPQNPRELRAEEEIAPEPCDQNPARGLHIGAQFFQQPQEPPVRDHARVRDQKN